MSMRGCKKTQDQAKILLDLSKRVFVCEVYYHLNRDSIDLVKRTSWKAWPKRVKASYLKIKFRYHMCFLK